MSAAEPRCNGCGKTPDELPCYTYPAAEEGLTPSDYVRREEGTFNPANGHFLCDDCFILEEITTGRRLVGPNGTRWIAP